MSEEPHNNEFEAEDGELLPDREVMSIVTTDPTDVIIPPGEPDYSIQPVEDPRDPPNRTLPVEPPGT